MVQAAVDNMMQDNQLTYIDNPYSVSGGEAVNTMGDNPDTEFIIEGFPDNFTPVRQKGYIGEGEPRDGYVLVGHDKISTGDPAVFTSVNYTDTLVTQYFYTCESSGKVRQWDDSYIASAYEFTRLSEEITLMQLTCTIQIYTLSE